MEPGANEPALIVILQRTMKTTASRTTISDVHRVDGAIWSWSLLGGVLLCAAMAGPFFAGRVYTFDDLGAFHLPLRWFYAACLKRGESFDWLPHLFGGFYLSGEGQVGTYHPLHWALYSWADFRLAFCLELLLAYPFMWAGLYVFFRRWLERRGAALWGAMAFSFGSFSMLHFIHMNAVGVVAHIGWLLWAIDVLLSPGSGASARRRHCAAGIAIVALTASQVLLGYPQYVWFSLLAETTFLFSKLLARRRAGATRLTSSATASFANPSVKVPLGWKNAIGQFGRWGMAKALGLLVGSVQLAATFEQLQISVRESVDSSFRIMGSLHPLNVVQLVAPYLLVHRVVGRNTHELGLYVGAVPLVLVAWWFWSAPRGKRRAVGYATAVAGLFALVLSFGRYTPIYGLQSYLPIIGGFRCPSRYSVLFQMAVAACAAVACCELCDRSCSPSRGSRGERYALTLPALVALLVAIASFAVGWRPYLAPVGKIMAGPLLLAMAAWLIAQCLQGRRWAPAALVVFTVVDLGAYGLSYAVYREVVPLELYAATAPRPPRTSRSGRCRVAYDLADLGEPVSPLGNRVLLTGHTRIDGYAGLPPARQLDYRNAETLRLASVRWVRSTPRTANIDGLRRYDEHWLEVPDTLPRVRWAAPANSASVAHPISVETIVPSSQRRPNPTGEIERDHNTKNSAVVRTENRLADRVAAPTDQVVLVGERPGKLWVRATASQRRLLIVADSFHPGWVATIDGQSTTLVRAEGDFIGCWVPAGSHEISFRFEPAGLWWGKRLSLLGMGLALVCYGGPFVAARCRQRRCPESVSNSLTTGGCTSAEAMATNDL